AYKRRGPEREDFGLGPVADEVLLLPYRKVCPYEYMTREQPSLLASEARGTSDRPTHPCAARACSQRNRLTLPLPRASGRQWECRPQYRPGRCSDEARFETLRTAS